MMGHKQILQHEQEAPAALLVERQRRASDEANSSTSRSMLTSHATRVHADRTDVGFTQMDAEFDVAQAW